MGIGCRLELRVDLGHSSTASPRLCGFDCGFVQEGMRSTISFGAQVVVQ